MIEGRLIMLTELRLEADADGRILVGGELTWVAAVLVLGVAIIGSFVGSVFIADVERAGEVC